MASFNFHIVDVKNLDSFYQIYGIAGFASHRQWLLPNAVFVLFIDSGEHFFSRHFQVLLSRKGNNVLFSFRWHDTWRCDIIRPSACFRTILPIPERYNPCTWPNLKTFAVVVLFYFGAFLMTGFMSFWLDEQEEERKTESFLHKKFMILVVVCFFRLGLSNENARLWGKRKS